MKRQKLFAVILIFFGLIAGLSLAIKGNKSLALTGTNDHKQTDVSGENTEPIKVTIAAVGDIMMHSPQMKAGYNSSSDQYNFDSFFSKIKPYLASADLALGNLETPLAGKERKYTGYPMFNSPTELASALKNSGFDVLTTANNHALDRGASGLIATLDNLDKYGLKYTGTARSSEERDRIMIEEVNGIKIAVLAYTYGTNGIPVPGDKPYLVNLIDETLILKDIQKAKELEADFTIACVHWGNEYQRNPNNVQRELAAKMIGWGVDAIIGSHPHVLQPAEQIIVNGQEGAREGFVIYSMGNFISNQKERYRDSSIVLNLELEKDPRTNRTVLKEASYIPTWVQRIANGKPVYRVLPVEQGIKDYEAKRDQLLFSSDYQRLKQVWEDTTSLLGKEGPIVLKSVN